MKKENRKHGKDGRLLPAYTTWSIDNFDNGYVTSHHNRFMVKIPGHTRANKNGWVLRSIAAYEAYHKGVTVTTEMNVHHIDGNRLNDSK